MRDACLTSTVPWSKLRIASVSLWSCSNKFQQQKRTVSRLHRPESPTPGVGGADSFWSLGGETRHGCPAAGRPAVPGLRQPHSSLCPLHMASPQHPAFSSLLVKGCLSSDRPSLVPAALVFITSSETHFPVRSHVQWGILTGAGCMYLFWGHHLAKLQPLSAFPVICIIG